MNPAPFTTTAVPPGSPAETALLALNNDHATALSFLDPGRFRALVAASSVALRVGTADALLLAFDQDADYASPNFLWFRARLARFVYVDRVVVAPGARRRGLASRLYASVLAAAAAAGHDRVVCEVNAVPPNPASDAFHAARGFRPVGTAELAGTGKTVRYLEHRLDKDEAEEACR